MDFTISFFRQEDEVEHRKDSDQLETEFASKVESPKEIVVIFEGLLTVNTVAGLCGTNPTLWKFSEANLTGARNDAFEVSAGVNDSSCL